MYARISRQYRRNGGVGSYLEGVDTQVDEQVQLVGEPLACVWVREVDDAETGLPEVPSARVTQSDSMLQCVRLGEHVLPGCSILSLDKVAALHCLLEDGGELRDVGVD